MNDSLLEQQGFILWFTGLSGAGNTTVGNEVLRMLQKQKISTRIIDGDEIKKRPTINIWGSAKPTSNVIMP